MKSVSDLGDLSGQRVLIRCDLNVPLDGDTITDDGRIRASLPTLNQLREAGAKVIVLAHLGRPKGQVNPKYSLAPAAKRLGELLGSEVKLADDVVGDSAQSIVAGLADGEVAMLENVRYEPGEESKDEAERGALADKYAALADVFVSDGFGVVHRKQASVYDIASRLPSAAGGLVKAEVEVLKRLTEDPARPYVVVLGGAKVSDKLAVIANLIKTADTLVIGGGMLFTFLAAQGHEVGKSLLEKDQLDTVKGYLDEAAATGKQILLPTDIVVAPEFKADSPPTVVAADAIPARSARAGHRPGVGEGVRRCHRQGQDGVLERPDGGRGVGELRRRHPGRGPGPHRGRRALGGRRRRLRGCGPRPRLRRRRVRAHLDRRRCQPGVPGGQDPAGSGRTRREGVDDHGP